MRHLMMMEIERPFFFYLISFRLQSYTAARIGHTPSFVRNTQAIVVSTCGRTERIKGPVESESPLPFLRTVSTNTRNMARQQLKASHVRNSP
jgi:hypothetical protein